MPGVNFSNKRVEDEAKAVMAVIGERSFSKYVQQAVAFFNQYKVYKMDEYEKEIYDRMIDD